MSLTQFADLSIVDDDEHVDDDRASAAQLQRQVKALFKPDADSTKMRTLVAHVDKILRESDDKV